MLKQVKAQRVNSLLPRLCQSRRHLVVDETVVVVVEAKSLCSASLTLNCRSQSVCQELRLGTTHQNSSLLMTGLNYPRISRSHSLLAVGT